jgi:HD-GYP domain-containing protein (c-di-GMP phosphodiesterase class II)
MGPAASTRPTTAGAPHHVVWRVRELEAQVGSLESGLICAFSQLLDLKDANTGFHSTRLAEWAVRVARDLGVDASVLHDIEVAALLHDIGKIGVPDNVLSSTNRLTDAEWKVMKKHPEYGWAVIRLFPNLARAALFVLHHHERVDGAGYPAGLTRDEIPIGARIVAVIDAFDAMVSNRSYRAGLPVDEAVRRLVEAKGSQFDPDVVDCFISRAGQDDAAVFAATGTGTGVAL